MGAALTPKTGSCRRLGFTRRPRAGSCEKVGTLPKAPKGTYKVETNYYASHQASASTGATSAIIWSVQHMGRFEQEALQFSTVRLTAHKQRQQVLELVAE